MLTLSRTKGQSIVVGGTIVFKIHSIRGNKVIVGVQAPENLPIHRGERIKETDDAGNKDRKELRSGVFSQTPESSKRM